MRRRDVSQWRQLRPLGGALTVRPPRGHRGAIAAARRVDRPRDPRRADVRLRTGDHDRVDVPAGHRVVVRLVDRGHRRAHRRRGAHGARAPDPPGLVVGPSGHADRGRPPFVLGATPAVVLALALMGFVGSIGAAALTLAVFFAAYFIAYETYRALYPDLVDDEIAARAQSTQALSRGAATVTALAAGGVLLALANAPWELSLAARLYINHTLGRRCRLRLRSSAPGPSSCSWPRPSAASSQTASDALG